MKSIILWIAYLLISCSIAWAGDDELSRQIHLLKTKGTVYEMLESVSELSGFLFIYDSQIINDSKKVKVAPGTYTIRDAVIAIVGDRSIGVKLVDKHILLYKQHKTLAKDIPIVEESHSICRGTVIDKETKEPIPYVSVSSPAIGIGTITNQDGQFLLKLPNKAKNNSLLFSHVGYLSQQLASQLFTERDAVVLLDTRIIPIPEVIVKISNPQKIVKDMLASIKDNYYQRPVYLTTFYREGMKQENKFSYLTEAVCKVYKTTNSTKNQAKMLKMRKINNKQLQDSLILKIKAGIESSFLLDIINERPDFFLLDAENQYSYSKIDMAITDSGIAHVIAFKPKKYAEKTYYQGELYIDADSNALLDAYFEIDPSRTDEIKDIFIHKGNKAYDLKPQSISYMVSYKKWNGKYHINHIRGDLKFKVKKKRQFLAQSRAVQAYFEMVTCKIDTLNVERFSKKEAFPPKAVFSETRYTYDQSFWGEFNTILTEEKLNEMMSRIKTKIEEEVRE